MGLKKRRIYIILQLCFEWRRKLMTKEVIKKYGKRVKYSEKELKTLHEGDHRIRHIE